MLGSDLADETGRAPAGAGGQPLLSVVLPVRNGGAFLGGALRALSAQACTFPWEAIVVDNASSDGSGEIARRFSASWPALRVLSEPRPGKPYALNTGIAAAAGEGLVLLDADDEVAPGYLAAMAAGLERYDLVSAEIDTTALNPPWAHGELLPPGRIAVFLDFLPYIPGGLVAIRASAAARIGPFDTDLPLGEDVDYTWRAHLCGLSAGLAPGAVLHVGRPRDAWGNFQKARGYGRSHVWLYTRYRSIGMPRRSLRSALGQCKLAAMEVLAHEDHWPWRMAWELGAVAGRLEESVRHRVWFP